MYTFEDTLSKKIKINLKIFKKNLNSTIFFSAQSSDKPVHGGSEATSTQEAGTSATGAASAGGREEGRGSSVVSGDRDRGRSGRVPGKDRTVRAVEDKKFEY